MSKLDNLEIIKSVDPDGMGDLIYGLPEQCEEAYKIAEDAAPPSGGRPANIVVLGMGGSAIGGDLVRSFLEQELPVPFIVSRDYSIPRFVGPETLIVASSYSGNTEETLSAYAEAPARGARFLAITTGGKLAELARRDNVPLVIIPGGLPPRAAIGYSFVPTMVILERLGLVASKEAGFTEMVRVLKDLRSQIGPHVPAEKNLAKQLAERFHGKLPLIYGSQPWKSVVAFRWKTQINENAKAIAFASAFPELNHNETVGWEAPQNLTKEVEVVLLRDRDDNPRVVKRFEVTSQIMREHVGSITEVWSVGASALARLFSLLYIGDYTSYYLAIMNDIDPKPVRVIDYLKSQLAAV